MTDPNVVCIVGPDGAGKSTQARKLVEALKRQGTDYEYRWLGVRHVFSLPLLAYARAAGFSEVTRLESGREIGYHYFWRSRLLETLYPVLLFLDTYLLYLVQVHIPTVLFGRRLVCDRFVHDIVVRAMLSTGDERFHESFLGGLFFRLVPEHSLTIMLTAEPETLRSRRDDVREDRTLERMLEHYEDVADCTDVHRVSAAGSPAQVHENIREILA